MRLAPPALTSQTRLGTAVLGFVGLLISQGIAWAQQPVPGQMPAPPSHPDWLDWTVTVGMFGLALFAVCRSSQRN